MVDEARYDIIYDKGTFDVVFMNQELSNEGYAQAIHFRLSSSNPNAIFIMLIGLFVSIYDCIYNNVNIHKLTHTIFRKDDEEQL